jgi:hypothetical protein
MADTTNFGWAKPTVGGSTGSWGTELNTLADDVDADLANVQTTAKAALPKSGGTMTGNVKVLTESLTAVNLGNVATNMTVNLALGNFFYGTMTGDITSVTISNPPSTGTAFFFALELAQDATGGRTISWPGAVKLTSGSTAPNETATNVYTWIFYTRDGGTRYRGVLAAETSA